MIAKIYISDTASLFSFFPLLCEDSSSHQQASLYITNAWPSLGSPLMLSSVRLVSRSLSLQKNWHSSAGRLLYHSMYVRWALHKISSACLLYPDLFFSFFSMNDKTIGSLLALYERLPSHRWIRMFLSCLRWIQRWWCSLFWRIACCCLVLVIE